MPKYTVEVRDRATIDIIATTYVEAATPQEAIEILQGSAKRGGQLDMELDFEIEGGLGWYERHYDTEYKIFDENGKELKRR